MPLEDLNLAEAARIVQQDFKNSFLPMLHDWPLFQSDENERLEALRARISTYKALPCRELPIPKSNLLSRPGALPVIDDWVVYTAVCVCIARRVEQNLIPPEQEVLFSFKWNEADRSMGGRTKGAGYPAFRSKSLSLLQEYRYALQTDITAYFEHIDLSILRGVLARLGAHDQDVEFIINTFLRRWAHRSGRGIPQGPWASSYLGNLYLDSVDKAMVQNGLTFVRYVDDMRVFCRSAIEARRAVLHLTELTRELGLSVQAAKTRILNRAQGQKEWRGYQEWLAEIQEGKLREGLREYFAQVDPYGEFDAQAPEDIVLEQHALEQLFDLITRAPAYKADRKGLRFVLPKLRASGLAGAIEYCLTHLAELPDISPTCADYLSVFSGEERVQEGVLAFISSDECIYDWQAMHLLGGVLAAERAIPGIVDFAFRIAQDRNRELGLRSTAIDFVAKFGAYEKVHELCRFFSKEPSEELRAAIIMASRRLHRTERARFLAGCKGLSRVLDAAVAYASRT